ncbi:helix-turn-helix domain-containing protein [Roseimaritima ulvae]|uniref:Response regulatory domain-containing protein n=1 Tax=Roseimaritima ulvae TaxID=980254 RepID=A0A5B9QWZ1_9BACT|nr:response regulator transcription factor [Roseimaritima ulvae]QEG42522.1 hypothetical protein UC8_45610 [Roseimaritima ulvae]
MNQSVTRVLLTVDQPLHAQLLKHAFATCPDLELVGEATEVIECMQKMVSKKPHLWIHSWDEGPELQAVLSHVYDSQPSLSVIRISLNEPAGYIQMQVRSLADLLKLATQTRLLLGAA